MTYYSQSPEETERIAEAFGGVLRPGDVVAFTGGLGTGKTTFIRGCARGLGYTGEVTSPTYSLVHEYSGNMPVYHFDMYRITSLDDLYSTGFFDYLDSGSVLLIEWSENITGDLPDSTIFVHIRQTGEEKRELTFEGSRPFDHFRN